MKTRQTLICLSLPALYFSAHALQPQPAMGTHPPLITVADILDNKEKPTEAWTGLDPKRYADLTFYDKNGTAHLKGTITDFTQSPDVSTFTVRTQNDFSGSQKISLGDINPDGSFEIDFPVAYPQFAYLELGPVRQNLFILPGDTLSIASCLETDKSGYSPAFFGFQGKTDDSVAINILIDSLVNERYDLKSLFSKYYVAESDTMKSETYKSQQRLVKELDHVVSDLPQLLGDLPVSSFVKDMLSAYAIGRIAQQMEDLDFYHHLAHGEKLIAGDDGIYTYKPADKLDYNKWLKPILKHKDLIYNNPALVCCNTILPNRWSFNDLFRDTGYAASGYIRLINEDGTETPALDRPEDPMIPYRQNDARLDSLGIGNCFVAQLVRTSAFIHDLKTTESPDSANLEQYSRLLPLLVKHTDSNVMNELAMQEYNTFVKHVMIAENAMKGTEPHSIIIPDSPGADVLKKIIEPYKGDVLFLDFWGIGCGPCRSGMIRQKPILEKLADKPFRALYIADADENMTACEKWLRNEEIGGEHIFVSGDDWKRLCSLFNISGIPHGVLIGKDGSVIKNGFNIELEEKTLTSAISQNSL